MWPPGTLLNLHRGSYDTFRLGRHEKRPMLCFVVSIEQIGFGTLGARYHIIFLAEGRLIHQMKRLDELERHFTVHERPS